MLIGGNMDKSLLLELRELILESLNTEQMETLGKDIDPKYNPSKMAKLPLGARLRDRKQASKILVEFAIEKQAGHQLVIDFIESNGKTVAGKKVEIADIEGFLARLTNFGLVYNREKGKLEEFDGNMGTLSNWGILKEGETYELAIMSIDIAGNSILQEKYEKADIENNYKKFMEHIKLYLERFKGKIWSWAGDGGLCAFYLDNKAQDAVKCAFGILCGMPLFNIHDNTLGEPLNIRIAIDRGNAAYKHDKGNIYSETINWVAHLEKKGTDTNSISISLEVYEALDEYAKSFFFNDGQFENKVHYKFDLRDRIGSQGKRKQFDK